VTQVVNVRSVSEMVCTVYVAPSLMPCDAAWHALCGAQRYDCRLRDLCGAMGVLEDAEGRAWGGELSHTGEVGPAACSVCQDGYYLDNADRTCKSCQGNCAICTGAGATKCETCKVGYYLKSDKSCSNTCDGNQYPDKQSGECKACSEIADCTKCAYSDNLGGPICSTCDGSNNLVKTAIDGSTTCVAAANCAVASQPGTHFLNKDNNGCIVCSITTDQTEGNKGVANCKTCQKTADDQNPTCSACLDGYFFTSSSNTCATKCDQSCRTCSEAVNANKCESCYPGYFLVTEGANKKCVSCDDTAKGGIDGCAECDNQSGTLKCTKCKPNRRSKGESGNYTCEEKTCEDETVCGGTAGSCDAIVISASGEMTYYCSQCADNSQYPIDGLCVDNSKKGNNQCSNGACQSCAANYFLYMGGCYKLGQVPGSYMCTDQTGSCTTPTSHYFLVPGATASQQSVLGCGNPLGTTVGDSAYVGVEDCKTCEAPTAATGMAAAKCTACDGSKKPTGSGYGCVTCGIAGCSACRADNMCGACGDGYRLEGDTCVRTGGNLSTGAIAGISVAAVVVVGGLVGFLCWWFICRGKA
ncbi:Variant-specific surface protein, partial [Giardia duodenalis]